MATQQDFAQYIAGIDDHEYLSELGRVNCKELPIQKPTQRR